MWNVDCAELKELGDIVDEGEDDDAEDVAETVTGTALATTVGHIWLYSMRTGHFQYNKG